MVEYFGVLGVSYSAEYPSPGFGLSPRWRRILHPAAREWAGRSTCCCRRFTYWPGGTASAGRGSAGHTDAECRSCYPRWWRKGFCSPLQHGRSAIVSGQAFPAGTAWSVRGMRCRAILLREKEHRLRYCRQRCNSDVRITSLWSWLSGHFHNINSFGSSILKESVCFLWAESQSCKRG